MSHYSEAVISELEAAGVAYTVMNGGKHKLAEWTAPNGQRRKCQIDITASDRRSAENARHDLRRVLKEDGLLSEKLGSPELFISGGFIFCSSLGVAERFRKAHKDVLRAYDGVVAEADAEFTGRNFALSSYRDASGRSLRCINMTRDGFSILAMGFTGNEATKWKVDYLKLFGQMEAQLKPASDLPDRVARLEEDLKAATDLLLETRQPETVIQTLVVRKTAFVRPSIQRAMKRAGSRS